MTAPTEQPQADASAVVSLADTLTIIDNRTGKQYEVPIEDGTIRATELRNMKTDEDGLGLMTYFPPRGASRHDFGRSAQCTDSATAAGPTAAARRELGSLVVLAAQLRSGRRCERDPRARRSQGSSVCWIGLRRIGVCGWPRRL